MFSKRWLWHDVIDTAWASDTISSYVDTSTRMHYNYSVVWGRLDGMWFSTVAESVRHSRQLGLASTCSCSRGLASTCSCSNWLASTRICSSAVFIERRYNVSNSFYAVTSGVVAAAGFSASLIFSFSSLTSSTSICSAGFSSAFSCKQNTNSSSTYTCVDKDMVKIKTTSAIIFISRW